MSKPVIVVGAGVVGLSCALVLSEKGYKVTVIARNLPTDALTAEYTSPWAGAHFRPQPSRSESDKKEMEMTRITQKYFQKLAVDEPYSSIKFVEGIEYFENPDSLIKDLGYGYTEDIEDFKVLDQKDLPEGSVFGTSYKAWTLNSPHYLRYLYNKLSFRYGVNFVRQLFDSLKDIFENYPKSTIINASGRGLQYDGGYDPQGFLIRGQTLLVRAPANCPYLEKTITHQSKDGLWTFVIGRPLDGGVILGGTKQVDISQTTPREEDTQALIARGKKLYPELFIDGELDIRNINVGFRPARKGGVRVEMEKKPEGNIIHAYGCGGMGYELSYGMAQKVFELFQTIPTTPKL